MTAASLEEISIPFTETNVIKLADWMERVHLMPRDTCLRHHVPDIQPSLPVALPLPGCCYQPSCILMFCVSASRCSKIKPHLLDNVWKFPVLLRSLWPTVSKDRFKRLVCLWLQSELFAELSVCMWAFPWSHFLCSCLQQPGTSAQTVFDRGITCALCGNI